MVSHPTHSFSERRERCSRLQSRSILQPGSRREEEPKFEEPNFGEKDLKAIKERYLGAQKVKKRVTKPSEKNRFIFDWHCNEDTTQDTKPLYERPHDARLVFGRGKDRFGLERQWSEKKREEMTERDWHIFGEDHNISYKGNRIRAHPMRNWEESGLIPELVEAVHRVGYGKPSPIQMTAIPISLQLRDMIGVAETGSGKTAAFVLPMLIYVSKLSKSTPEDGPHAVIMAPTRELVMQITSETEKFARFLKRNNPRMVSIVGGKSIEEQSQKLLHGCEILIATPGRLLDCLERRYAVLNQCKYVVLDEANRMIDMGFEQQVRAVLDAMPCSHPKQETGNPNPNSNSSSSLYRTTVMFSATMPSAVERIAKNYLRDPVTVTIEPTANLITQTVHMLRENEKFGKLCRLLNDIHSADQKALVFVNTRDRVETLTRDLDRHSYRVASLHGGKAQQEREAALSRFRNVASGFQCLLATDVAGRGIDIPDVAHVVNYDMPASIEQYTHRIGRTGRAGKPGVATTFLTPSDSALYRDLLHVLEQNRSRVPPDLARHSRTSLGHGRSYSQELDA